MGPQVTLAFVALCGLLPSIHGSKPAAPSVKNHGLLHTGAIHRVVHPALAHSPHKLPAVLKLRVLKPEVAKHPALQLLLNHSTDHHRTSADPMEPDSLHILLESDLHPRVAQHPSSVTKSHSHPSLGTAQHIPDILNRASTAFASADSLLKRYARGDNVGSKALQSALQEAKNVGRVLGNSNFKSGVHGLFQRSLELMLAQVVAGLKSGLHDWHGSGGFNQSRKIPPQKVQSRIFHHPKVDSHPKVAAASPQHEVVSHPKVAAAPQPKVVSHPKVAAAAPQPKFVSHPKVAAAPQPKVVSHPKVAAAPQPKVVSHHTFTSKPHPRTTEEYVPVAWESIVLVNPEHLKEVHPAIRHPHLATSPQLATKHHEVSHPTKVSLSQPASHPTKVSLPHPTSHPTHANKPHH